MRTKKVVLWGGLTLLAGGLGSVGYSVYQGLFRPPRQSIDAYLRKGTRKPGRKLVVCAGASTIHGRISFDVVDLLQHRLGQDFDFVNAGKNGDLAYNLLQRLGPIIAVQPDYLVILVGTNDVSASLDPKAARTFIQWKGLPTWPSIEWYGENLRGIVRTLKDKTHARIALSSLQVLGEDLESPANQRVATYNAIVKTVTEEERIDYLPFFETQVEFLRRVQSGPGRRHEGNALMLKAMYQRYALGRSFDAISAANGFQLLTDGIHLNSRGGGMLAEQIEAFLRGRVPAGIGQTAGQSGPA